MRWSHTLVLFALASCKTPAQPAARPPAAAPTTDDDQWRGFGGNEHPPETTEEPREPDDLLHRACHRMAELAEDEGDLPSEAKDAMQDIPRCLAEGAKDRERDPEKFELQATCVIEGSSMSGVMQCLMALQPSVVEPEVSPEPESTDPVRRACERFVRFSLEQSPGSFSEVSAKELLEECLQEFGQMQEADPNDFERHLECLEDTDSFEDYAACIVNP